MGATTPPRRGPHLAPVRLGVPFTHTPDGRPYLYAVRISEPNVFAGSLFLARFVEWRDGAVVMTLATPGQNNPNDRPADHLIICPIPGSVVLIDYIGPEEDR